MHIACLCGDNGNGKSAIFDALTWALWGKSRAESDDSLIHFGQTDMQVELEFMLKEQKYRVIRMRYKKDISSRSGQSTLELHIYDEYQGYKVISGNTISETQTKITKLLHMDYETFVNSAFLRQGHANDFSIKRPAERKEILVNILGLDIYDTLVDKAREEITIKRNMVASITQQIAAISNFLASKNTLFQESLKLTEQKKESETKRKNLETKIINLRERRALLEVKREKYSNISLRNIEIEKELDGLNIKIEKCTTKLESYREILNRRSLIEHKYSEFVDLKKRMDVYNEKLSQVVNLQSKIRHVEEYLNKIKQGIIIDFEKSKETLKVNKDMASQLDILQGQQIRINEELNSLLIQESDLQIKHKSYDNLVTLTANIKANIDLQDSQLKDNIEKARLLEASDSKCPLCGQVITATERENIKNRFLQSAVEAKQRKASSLSDLDDKNKEQEILLKIIHATENNIKDKRNDLLKQAAILQNRMQEVQKTANNLPEINNKVLALEQQLVSKNYALEEYEELHYLLENLDNIKYDKQEHETFKTKLEQVQEYEILKYKLNEAINMSANEQKILDEAKIIVSNSENLLKANNEQLYLLSLEIKDFEESMQILEQQEEYLKILLEEEGNLLAQIAINQERIKELENMEEDKRKKELTLHNLQTEENIYRDLIEAFGKKGVQALLISQAFPEIEIEANRLLSKMSDNKLSLKLESRKESKGKKGESIETLDIKISDELGTRDYEMFSGGESFRIDLALRIALSKLLVRRAGASLPVLIIDEGFGTQDNTGKERLIEAIKSIEDDFEKIFVITHLEDLKENFPLIINVNKTADGSSITIS